MGQQKTKIIGMEGLGKVSLEQVKKVGRKRVKKQESSTPPKETKAQPPTSDLLTEAAAQAGAIEQIKQVELNPETIEQVEQKAKRPRVGRAKVRSHRYQQVLALVDRKQQYGLDEALELVKKTSYASFDATVELHIKTLTKKGQDPIRSVVALPAGAVKTPKVAVASEELIPQIEKGKLDFDILLATPEVMPKLAKVAKILGPKGMMPSPKSGTIVEDPAKAIEAIQKGRVEVRQDALGNIHVVVGKVSWPTVKIKQNIEAILQTVPSNRIDSISLSATMGPGIKVASV